MFCGLPMGKCIIELTFNSQSEISSDQLRQRVTYGEETKRNRVIHVGGKTAKPSLKPKLPQTCLVRWCPCCIPSHPRPHRAPSQPPGRDQALLHHSCPSPQPWRLSRSSAARRHLLIPSFLGIKQPREKRPLKTDTRVGLLQLSTESLHQVAVVLLVTHSKQRSEKQLFPPSTGTFQCIHFGK